MRRHLFHKIPPHHAALLLICHALQAGGRQPPIQSAAMILTQKDGKIHARIFHKIHVPCGVEVIAVDGKHIKILPSLHHIRVIGLGPAKPQIQMVGIHFPAGHGRDTNILRNQPPGKFPDILPRTRITGGTVRNRPLQRGKAAKIRFPGLIERLYRHISFL